MEKFEYLVLSSVETPNGPNWVGSDGRTYGLILPTVLNQLGLQGWELVMAADVIRAERDELFLKRRKN